MFTYFVNDDENIEIFFQFEKTDSDKVNDAIAGWSFQDDESNKVIVEERSLIEEKYVKNHHLVGGIDLN